MTPELAGDVQLRLGQLIDADLEYRDAGGVCAVMPSFLQITGVEQRQARVR